MKTLVVDLGCADHGHVNSLEMLARVFRPEHIYGFDPSPSITEGETEIEGVPVTLKRSAAWLHDGTVLYTENGWGSRIGEGPHEVECFDFSRWLKKLKRPRTEIIVKVDIEGAEYPLLEDMIARGTDKLVSQFFVEWHGDDEPLRSRLTPPVRWWWM